MNTHLKKRSAEKSWIVLACMTEGLLLMVIIVTASNVFTL